MFVESHIEYRDTRAWVKYLELTDEIGILGLPPSALNKFWEISILGAEVTECSGKIGTPAKTNQTKSFKNDELARKYVENAIWTRVCLNDYESKSARL